MGHEYAETVIVGAGQQGCGVAAALKEAGHESVVLERGVIGQAWAYERWDSLRVHSGNRSVLFPGWAYDGNDPDGLMPGPDLADHMRHYATRRGLAIREHTPVRAIERAPGAGDRDDVRFRTHLCTGEVVESRHLVAALGGYSAPWTPEVAAGIDPAVVGIHSRHYRSSAALPVGAVLVVGAGISGQQIADELLDAGRRVFLSVGRHRAFPRRYRGRPVQDWIFALSLYEHFVADGSAADGNRKSSTLLGLPVTAVNSGDADLNLATLVAKGATLVGSIRTADGHRLRLADNVVAIADEAARSYHHITGLIDDRLAEGGYVAPEHQPATEPDLGPDAGFGTELDLRRNGITTVIWCTGFRPDYRILPDDMLDEHGVPLCRQGIVGVVPGSYFPGLPDAGSVAQAAIPSNVANGRLVAHRVHLDHMLRSGSPISLRTLAGGVATGTAAGPASR